MTFRERKIPTVPVNCGECPVRNLTICQPLCDHDLEIVQRFKTSDRILPAGSPLYRQDEICTELYNVLDGWVVLYRLLESGKRQILDFALPGAFLGRQPDLDQPMLHGADCLTDVSVCVFPRRRFRRLLEDNPSLAIRLASMNARDAVIAHDHVTNVGSRTARGRIGNLLLELCLRLRPKRNAFGDLEIEIPLTQHHIADALGLTSVYVSQTLKQLREQELLVFKNGRLRILDLKGLGKVADFNDLLVI